MAEQHLVAVPEQALAAGLQGGHAAAGLVVQQLQQLAPAQLAALGLVHHAVQGRQQHLHRLRFCLEMSSSRQAISARPNGHAHQLQGAGLPLAASLLPEVACSNACKEQHLLGQARTIYCFQRQSKAEPGSTEHLTRLAGASWAQRCRRCAVGAQASCNAVLAVLESCTCK